MNSLNDRNRIGVALLILRIAQAFYSCFTSKFCARVATRRKINW